MAQHGADRVERRAVAEQPGRERMAQDVGSPGRRLNAGAPDRATDDIAHAARANRVDGRAGGQEDVVRGGGGPLGLEVPEHRIARVLRQRQPCLAPPLADDAEPSPLPLNVAEPERDDVPRAQTEAGEQQQHGAIAPRHGAGAIAGLDDALYIGIREVAGERGQPPRGHRGHGLDEVWRAPTVHDEPPEEASDDRRDAARRRGRMLPDVLEHEPAHARGIEPGGIVAHGPEQGLDHRQRVGNRRDGQAAPVAHPRAVLGHQRRTHRLRRGRGHDAPFAQVPQERVDSERHPLVATAFAAAPASGQVTHKTREQILIEICHGHAALRGPLAYVVGVVQVGAYRLGRVAVGAHGCREAVEKRPRRSAVETVEGEGALEAALEHGVLLGPKPGEWGPQRARLCGPGHTL